MSPRFVRSAKTLAMAAAFTVLAPLGAGCSSAPAGDEGRLGTTSQALTTYGDWASYGDGQCVIGAQIFYKAKFSVTLSPTGLQTTDVGACAYLGACMYWVSPKVEPDAATWDRHPWGSEMPKLYDLVIFPPSGTNAYGHVASVDHMEGTDPNAYKQMYVMDSNYTVAVKKSPAIHTTSVQPYGFYRLKSQRGPFCTPGLAHLNCGDEAYLHDADKDTLYKCSGITATVVEKCAAGCVHEAAGTDDRCATAPAADAGSDAADAGDAAVASDSADTGGASDAIGSTETGAADDAGSSDGDLQSSIGCTVPRDAGRRSGPATLALCLAGLLALRRVRSRRDRKR